MLKILFIGDVSGEVGREAVKRVLPDIKNKHKPDLIIADVENAAGGRGVTREIVEEMTNARIDLCTAGDHAFGMKDFHLELASNDLEFIRPANYDAPNVPGNGYKIIDMGEKGRVCVVTILGQEGFTFTQRVQNPFFFIDKFLEIPEVKESNLIFIEFHGETTSEKLAFAWYVRDRAQTVVGTHTHVSTADNRLLGGKIAYVSDVGQVGPYDASLWVKFDDIIHNFKYPFRQPSNLETEGPRIFNSVLIHYENADNGSKNLSPVKIESGCGARLGKYIHSRSNKIRSFKILLI